VSTKTRKTRVRVSRGASPAATTTPEKAPLVAAVGDYYYAKLRVFTPPKEAGGTPDLVDRLETVCVLKARHTGKGEAQYQVKFLCPFTCQIKTSWINGNDRLGDKTTQDDFNERAEDTRLLASAPPKPKAAKPFVKAAQERLNKAPSAAAPSPDLGPVINPGDPIRVKWEQGKTRSGELVRFYEGRGGKGMAVVRVLHDKTGLPGSERRVPASDVLPLNEPEAEAEAAPKAPETQPCRGSEIGGCTQRQPCLSCARTAGEIKRASDAHAKASLQAAMGRKPRKPAEAAPPAPETKPRAKKSNDELRLEIDAIAAKRCIDGDALVRVVKEVTGYAGKPTTKGLPKRHLNGVIQALKKWEPRPKTTPQQAAPKAPETKPQEAAPEAPKEGRVLKLNPYLRSGDPWPDASPEQWLDNVLALDEQHKTWLEEAMVGAAKNDAWRKSWGAPTVAEMAEAVDEVMSKHLNEAKAIFAEFLADEVEVVEAVEEHSYEEEVYDPEAELEAMLEAEEAAEGGETWGSNSFPNCQVCKTPTPMVHFLNSRPVCGVVCSAKVKA
jgi:hypothetical protein